jgi:magnesium transporter
MSENLLTKELLYEKLFDAMQQNERETFRKLFLTLHERDQQEFFHLLYPENKGKITDFLSAAEFSEIFEWMDLESKEDIIVYLPEEYIVAIFNYLPTDVLADFVFLTTHSDITALLEKMEPEEQKRLREVMTYEDESAGSIMTKEYFFIYAEETTQKVIERLREFGQRAETIYYLYVVDGRHHLVGVLSLRDLLLASETTKVQEIMNTQTVKVLVNAEQKEAITTLQTYDLIALPVVREDNRLVGIITVDDVMDIVELENAEDFQAFAGISTTTIEETDEMTPFMAAKQRSPWIVLLLFLSMITGSLIGFFESTLASVVSLAAFIPLIMGAAGNVGTQSLAVSLRNMNNENKNSVKLSHVLFQEMQAGAFIGLIASVVIFGIVTVLYKNIVLAFIVGISVLLSITAAAVVGTIIPELIQKLNFDPAVASGPFISTINDTLGLLIYFATATTLLGLLQ